MKRLLSVLGLTLAIFEQASYAGYDPEQGRWISRDPLPVAEILQGANLYSYVKNEPIGWIDSLGLDRYQVDNVHTSTIVQNPNSSTGYSKIEFGPTSPGILVLAPGGVTITDVDKPTESNSTRKIASTPCEDQDLMNWALEMQADPPAYNTFFFNCRDFSAIAGSVGMMSPDFSQPLIPLLPPVLPAP